MLLKILADLSYCQKPVEISSFNEHLIADLLLYQKNHELDYAELGLIVNLFKDIKYRVDFPWECKDISFVSIFNELLEWPIVGSSYQFYRDLLPNVRKYAWSWDAIYTETEKRIHNYISSGVEGIITAKPELVRKLMKR